MQTQTEQIDLYTLMLAYVWCQRYHDVGVITNSPVPYSSNGESCQVLCDICKSQLPEDVLLSEILLLHVQCSSTHCVHVYCITWALMCQNKPMSAINIRLHEVTKLGAAHPFLYYILPSVNAFQPCTVNALYDCVQHVNVNANNRLNIWTQRRSQFWPTGSPFTSPFTDEASVIECLA